MADDKYQAIVLSGGGVKGILQLGALHYYHEKKSFDHDSVQQYAGTSIGSVIVLLLNVGYTPMQIFNEIYNLDSFFDVSKRSPWELITNMGLLSIDTFANKISKLIEKKIGSVPTLKQLYEKTGKTLTVSATNVSKMREDRLNYITHPDLSCVDAVKISCNLPVIFQRIKFNHDFVIDGFINNVPWDYITPETKTLCIVTSSADVASSAESFLGYFMRIVMLPINQITSMKCDMAPKNVHVIRLSCESGHVISLSMAKGKKSDMFHTGYENAMEHDTTLRLTLPDWPYISDDKWEEWEWQD
jgi:predicted acylesterase/phospholipase RssA